MCNAPPGTPDLQERHRVFRVYVQPEIEVLLRVARTLTGSWPDVEDLVQDTMVRAFRAIGTFDGAHPRAWLMTILRHTNLNSHRRGRPDLAPDPGYLEGGRPAFGATAVSSPEQIVIDQFFEQDVSNALASLDPRFRTVLLLIDVDQLTYAEVAQVLGIPIGTVMSRLSRARDRVRTHLPDTSTSRRHR